jgi:hypothetical protein
VFCTLLSESDHCNRREKQTTKPNGRVQSPTIGTERNITERNNDLLFLREEGSSTTSSEDRETPALRRCDEEHNRAGYTAGSCLFFLRPLLSSRGRHLLSSSTKPAQNPRTPTVATRGTRPDSRRQRYTEHPLTKLYHLSLLRAHLETNYFTGTGELRSERATRQDEILNERRPCTVTH